MAVMFARPSATPRVAFALECNGTNRERGRGAAGVALKRFSVRPGGV